MGAGELDIEERILVTRTKYSIYMMNLEYYKYGQPNIAQPAEQLQKQYSNKYLILFDNLKLNLNCLCS